MAELAEAVMKYKDHGLSPCYARQIVEGGIDERDATGGRK